MLRVVSINKVALHRAWLVLGRVAVFGWVNHLGKQPGHSSEDTYVGTVSTGNGFGHH